MHSNSVFREIIKVLPNYKFLRLKDRLSPREQSRGFSHWSHFLTMIYCQLGGHESLRKLSLSFNEHHSGQYHIGASKVNKSSLSRSNNGRNPELFAEVLRYLVGISGGANKDCKDILRIIDSSPIHLDADVFGEFSKSNGRCQGAKLHLEYDANGRYPVFFDITPANVNDIEIVGSLEIIPNAVLSAVCKNRLVMK